MNDRSQFFVKLNFIYFFYQMRSNWRTEMIIMYRNCMRVHRAGAVKCHWASSFIQRQQPTTYCSTRSTRSILSMDLTATKAEMMQKNTNKLVLLIAKIINGLNSYAEWTTSHLPHKLQGIDPPIQCILSEEHAPFFHQAPTIVSSPVRNSSLTMHPMFFSPEK